jgi:hypothetical protein
MNAWRSVCPQAQGDRCDRRSADLFNGEIFYTLREAQIVIESWRHHYNKMRPPRLTWNQAISAGGVRARLRQRGRQPMVPTDARSALSVVRCKTLPFFLLKLS